MYKRRVFLRMHRNKSQTFINVTCLAHVEASQCGDYIVKEIIFVLHKKEQTHPYYNKKKTFQNKKEKKTIKNYLMVSVNIVIIPNK